MVGKNSGCVVQPVHGLKKNAALFRLSFMRGLYSKFAAASIDLRHEGRLRSVRQEVFMRRAGGPDARDKLPRNFSRQQSRAETF